MEKQEKDVLFLMALAVSGAVLASGLAAFQQWMVLYCPNNRSFPNYDSNIFPVQT